MLQINNLTIRHRKDLRALIENLSFTLNAGDKAVIIGEEGNGKTTLLKWIFDPSTAPDYVEYEGQRAVVGERLGYLMQELPEAVKKQTAYEYFCGCSGFLTSTPKQIAAIAVRLSLDPSIPYSQQLIGQMSGGEKVKLQLFRLLLDEPTVLLLDEPSNDLDIDTLELLESFINSWQGIVLFVSHDETLIENTANVIIHLELMRRKEKSRVTVKRLSYRQFVIERERAFDKQRQMAISDRRDKRIRDEKYRRILQSVNHALATVSRQDPSTAKNLKDKMHTVKSMGRRFEKEDENMTPMPEREDAIYLTLGGENTKLHSGKRVLEYTLDSLQTPDGGRELARNIELTIIGPEKICIIGKNGVGKTTLIRKIAKDLLQREDIIAAYMPQNYAEVLDDALSPVEFLQEEGGKEELTCIRAYLGSLRYTTEEMERPISELSGGQKGKVLLLKLALSSPDMLILDEPTRNFSPLSNPVIRRMVDEFPGAVIAVSHDRKFIDEVCDKVYELTSEGLVLKDKLKLGKS
ncbi:MAG: ATP-binding cassette domain-containing protein [Christensenellales bacterium]|jgi:ATPase subunit of ABC transporter with duplicated ATPase domains